MLNERQAYVSDRRGASIFALQTVVSPLWAFRMPPLLN